MSLEILNQLRTTIAVTNQSGDIIFVNQAWKSFGDQNDLNQAAHCVGENYFQHLQNAQDLGLIPSNTHGDLGQIVQDILSGKLENYNATYPCPSPSTERWFLMRIYRIFHQDEPHLVISHDNITKLKKAQQSLAESKLETEIAYQLKDNLIASISHEFRTPLHVIQNSISLVNSNSAPTHLRPYLKEIHEQTEKLSEVFLSLVNIANSQHMAQGYNDYPFMISHFMEALKGHFQQNLGFNLENTLHFKVMQDAYIVGDIHKMLHVVRYVLKEFIHRERSAPMKQVSLHLELSAQNMLSISLHSDQPFSLPAPLKTLISRQEKHRETGGSHMADIQNEIALALSQLNAKVYAIALDQESVFVMSIPVVPFESSYSMPEQVDTIEPDQLDALKQDVNESLKAQLLKSIQTGDVQSALNITHTIPSHQRALKDFLISRLEQFDYDGIRQFLD